MRSAGHARRLNGGDNMRIMSMLLLSWCVIVVLSGCGKRASSIAVASKATAKGDAPKVAAPPTDGFAFPRDQGGKLLTELLAPRVEATAPREPSVPRSLSGPASLERPELRTPLLPSQAGLPTAPLTSAAPPIRPRLLPEEPPWSRGSIEPPGPQRLELPAGPRLRSDARAVDQPVPLPILAQPVHDRAALDDPTARNSIAAVLATIIPDRAQPAPFVRLNLPEPFAYRQTIQLKVPPVEAGTPSSPGAKASGR